MGVRTHHADGPSAGKGGRPAREERSELPGDLIAPSGVRPPVGLFLLDLFFILALVLTLVLLPVLSLLVFLVLFLERVGVIDWGIDCGRNREIDLGIDLGLNWGAHVAGLVVP